jgi:integrase
MEEDKQSRRRHQQGSVVQISGKWFIRYWQTQKVNRCRVCGLTEDKPHANDHKFEREAVLERKRASHCISAIETRGKTPPQTVVDEAAQFMRTVNDSPVSPTRTVTLAQFVEDVFLPHADEYLRESTAAGYRSAWERHIRPVVIRDRVLMKSVRTYDVQRWLNKIATQDLGRNTLKNCKSILSGAFKLAKQLGYYDGVNPVRDSAISPTAAEPAETTALTLDEIKVILALLPQPAATIFGTAAYSGLRHGELQGLDWQDYHDGALWVSRSVWRNRYVNDPKTRKSKAPVPVIRQLAEQLEMHRLRDGNPQSGPMFRNTKCSRLNLNNVLARVIKPALKRCEHCGNAQADHSEAKHDFKLNEKLPKWHGWHACRRGLATNLYRLGVPSKVIQQILRHSNVSVTEAYYIRPMGEDVLRAMENLEANLDSKTVAQPFPDTQRTLKLVPSATLRAVN